MMDLQGIERAIEAAMTEVNSQPPDTMTRVMIMDVLREHVVPEIVRLLVDGRED